MTPSLRLLVLAATAAMALALTACGNKHETTTVGETEGIYVDVAGLQYQVQMSRQLNPADPEDAAYLTDLPGGEELGAEETYFAIFLRAQNVEQEPLPAATDFHIVDTQGETYEPLELGEDNVFRYPTEAPRTLRPDELLPEPGTPAASGPIQGSLLLFRLPIEALQNRPLELIIEGPHGAEEVEAEVNLDI